METRVRASGEHLSTLLDFMESHGDLSNPQGGPQGRLKSERLSSELAMLNSIGGGVNKSTDKWKKTGGGPNARQILATFEERVMDIMGKVNVECQPSIQEQGFSSTSQLTSSPTQALTPPPATQQQDTIDFEIATADVSVAISTPAPVTPPSSSSCHLPQMIISAQASTSHLDQSARRRSMVQPTPPAPSTPQSTSMRRLPFTPRSGVVVTSPARMTLRARRKRKLMPFDRATSEFVDIEQQRLRLEDKRGRQFHERETRRIEIESEYNHILRWFANIAQAWLDYYRSKDNTEHLDNMYLKKYIFHY